jgi:virginiamycin A acetyltransferase
LFDPDKGNRLEAIETGPTVIGNDVWIGLGATVLSGVMIGDGAVIGAGSVVSKSVPSYAVVVGNPAHIVHYRFDEITRRRLLALSWWDWDDAKIRELRHWFMTDIESFLQEMERTHDPRPESALTMRLNGMPAGLLVPHRVDPQT